MERDYTCLNCTFCDVSDIEYSQYFGNEVIRCKCHAESNDTHKTEWIDTELSRSNICGDFKLEEEE